MAQAIRMASGVCHGTHSTFLMNPMGLVGFIEVPVRSLIPMAAKAELAGAWEIEWFSWTTGPSDVVPRLGGLSDD